jgi:hypothetical protein
LKIVRLAGSLTNATYRAHNPASSIIVHVGIHGRRVAAVRLRAAAFSARLCRGLLVLGGARVAVSRRSQKISNSITGVVGSPKFVRRLLQQIKVRWQASRNVGQGKVWRGIDDVRRVSL